MRTTPPDLTAQAAILEREPPAMASLQPLAPPHVAHIVTRCLAKHSEERWQTASDVVQELKWASVPASSAVGTPVVVSPRAGWRRRLPGAAAGLALGAAAASALWMVLGPAASGSPPVVRVRMDLPDSVRGGQLGVGVHVSADGGGHHVRVRCIRLIGAGPG